MPVRQADDPVGPTPAPSFKTIPKGYTFLNATTFASRSTVDLLAKYLDKVADQYPEDDNPAGMWKMMNDSDAYVILDLIDEQLSAVHGKMLKKLWDEAYAHIHALTLFMDSEDHWQNADDGERVELTDKVYGACLVTIFHTLQKQDRLTLESFPDLESFLRSASNWGKNMSGVGSQTLGYWKVCKTIARQLYSNKWAETKALHEKMRDEWIESLDEQDKKDAREELAPNSDDDSDDGTNPWFKQREGETDGSEDRRNFVVSRIWKEYKLFLRGGQPGPVRKCLVPAGWTSHDASLALARGRDMYGGDSD